MRAMRRLVITLLATALVLAACSGDDAADESSSTAPTTASGGWPAATKDTIVWPIGLADPPSLVAYRVPSG